MFQIPMTVISKICCNRILKNFKFNLNKMKISFMKNKWVRNFKLKIKKFRKKQRNTLKKELKKY